ncbi:MAG: glycosyltransferase family 2 protein [Rugosibacter sp.]
MNIVFLLLWLPLAIWVGVLLLQSICAVSPAPGLPLASLRPRVAILIPAHNEGVGIAATLQSLLPQLQPGDRLLVVADNCDDDTAAVAAAAGAEVAKRCNATERGKGYALDYGLRRLAKDAPEVVIMIDADCIAEAGAIDCLAKAAATSGRPIQALYLMRSPQTGGTFGQLREFAWLMRNLVRPMGYLRLGQPCQLMGTGMAFPWPLIASVPLASAHLVEDMQLGADLARAGAAPLFCPQAVVRSEFPASGAGLRQQRRRWEHGHLGMIANRVPALLAEAIKYQDPGLFALALDMSVPPLALLVLLLGALAALSIIISSALAVALAFGLLFALSAAILLAWRYHGRAVLSLRALLLAPAYALAKLPLYAGFLRRRQTEWVRSSRD